MTFTFDVAYTVRLDLVTRYTFIIIIHCENKKSATVMHRVRRMLKLIALDDFNYGPSHKLDLAHVQSERFDAQSSAEQDVMRPPRGL